MYNQVRFKEALNTNKYLLQSIGQTVTIADRYEQLSC